MSHIDCQIDDFLKYVASEKGLAQNTVESYRRDAQTFGLFLQKIGIEDFKDVSEHHIVDFLGRLKSQKYATSSISRCLIALKVLFRFLKRENLVSTNVTFYLETPKLWQLIPEVLTNDEVERLLAQPDPQTSYGARDKAILEVLYASGLRVSELCSLNLYSVDEEFVRVKGKGSKERLVPIGSKAVQAIDFYLANYRDHVDSERQQSLFVTKSGRSMDRITVWKMIKQYAKQAGILKNISPHTLRHSFATHLLDNGADLRVIQEMLGHSNISSTDRYTHISRSHLQEAFDKFSPRVSLS